MKMNCNDFCGETNGYLSRCTSDERKVHEDPVAPQETHYARESRACVSVSAPTRDGSSFMESIGRWLSRRSLQTERSLRTKSMSLSREDDEKTRSELSDREWKDLSRNVKKWQLCVDDLAIGELLGAGAFGTTFKGTFNGQPCAVKKLRVTTETVTQFMREMSALSKVHDPHVVSFMGAVVERQLNACWIVQEFVPCGTLNDAIRKNGYNALAKKSVSKRLQILADVASGMAALERQDPPILHRDLKPSNIFLDEDMRAKIGDMGLAKILNAENNLPLTAETGTYLYMAPEVIGHEPYGTSADVWSWAATAVEVLTFKFPYQDKLLTPIQIAVQVMKHKMHPEVPERQCSPALQDLLNRCFSFEPSRRPSFSSIVDSMSGIIEQQIQEEASQSLNRSWSVMNLFEI